jgi:Transposase DNA-binding/Transposase Tn5 dimerisation domain
VEVFTEPRAWAQQQFGQVSLGDRRRTRRLVHSAATIACYPQQSFPQIFDWNELRGFYGLCHTEEATLSTLQQPHWKLTRQAMAQHPLVLVLHDTTQLDFTSHAALDGQGPIGEGHASGFLQHNSLAVVPQPRQVLGLAYQQFKVRQPAPQGETSAQRKRRQRESDLWLEGIEASGRPPQGCCWVDVGDAGSDIYEAMVAARQAGHHFLFRASQDRLVLLAPQPRGPEVPLLSHARSLPSQGQGVVDIPSRGGRPARTAVVQLAAAPVWVPAPTEVRKRWQQPILAVWVIRVWETDPPAGVQEPLEWVLLCSVPTVTVADINERRGWYSCRWLAEVFHDIEKNGCLEEDRRFETAESMEACLAVLSVVAVRVFQLRCALQVQPEAPAEQVATTSEIAVLRGFVAHKKQRLTVREFVRGVGRLGGFLGRTGDGEPGVRSLWRGYQRLQDMVLGFHLHDSPKPGHNRLGRKSGINNCYLPGP